jgi:hypothetical protein
MLNRSACLPTIRQSAGKPAERGRLHSKHRAFEQLHFERPLQPPDALAQSRLRDGEAPAASPIEPWPAAFRK